MRYRCPVCVFDRLPYPAADYHICPCCGTEFGNDDAEFSHSQLREMWVGDGAHWFFGNPAADWNPWMQLIAGGQAASIPFAATLTLEGDATLRREAEPRVDPVLRVQDRYSISLAA